MWKSIAIGTGIIGIIGGAICIRIKIIEDDMHLVVKEFLEMERRDMLRYTTTELKQVVGQIPNEKWTDEHIKQLEMIYLERVRKCAKYWKQMNEELEIDKKTHPEKYQGLLHPIKYGHPNLYLFTNDMAYQMKKYNDAYKCLEKESDDKDYTDWVSSEVERLEIIKNKKLDEMLKRINRL